MPTVEILPSSSSTAQPGYAYVPDTRLTSAQLSASQPVTSRKRGARSTNFGTAATTARQQNALLKHLADLDRDNHRDVQIPIPKETGSRVSKAKSTTNVRRILTSQKTFANHLADEEAALAQKGPSAPSTVIPSASTSEQATAGSKKAAGQVAEPEEDPLEADPLLRTYVPAEPLPEVMEALVTAPPLSYNAARATLTPNAKPRRYFCEICGYWGSIKCMNCGARVCGLDCKGAHDEGRCLKFYG